MSLEKGKLLWIAAVTCVAGGLATAAFAGGSKASTIIAFQDAKFAPFDPSNANGPQVAALSGNPGKGPSIVLLKLKKGAAPLHTHSSEYQATVIQGTHRHWDKGQEAKDAKPLGPGSYFKQPGKQVHGDECMTDECLLLIVWTGKMDFKMADAPKDAPK